MVRMAKASFWKNKEIMRRNVRFGTKKKIIDRVLSDRENRENREKSGNLVGREKSGKSQGICCLDREKIIKAFYSSNRYPVYLTYDVILCSCCIYVIVHISFHLF